ncbi:hypothetical protein K469DRAFT_687618 [Zopfia rhizophila CBS 207.26]|uniref:Cupin type-2 domain-containing protein n=1 Tax=Zopfia rhizophila CBS 207.26 TaxID=1314779 RepID=A0A6A6E7D5_9PEZI|nr:hypothetical protein K469DRAFT_687618 [Zopfia rhizophila CBS 207.26]
MALPTNNLPQYSRYITAHDSNGLSIFSPAYDPSAPKRLYPNNSAFHLDYTTSSTPVSFTSNADLKAYDSDVARCESLAPYFTAPNGSAIRHADTPPGGVSPMHRTLTLDYGIVLEGEIDLMLDSGEVRNLKRGDTIIQRGTMHAWRNRSETEWARMLFIILPIEEGWEMNGQVMKEEFRAPPVKNERGDANPPSNTDAKPTFSPGSADATTQATSGA